MFCQHITTYLIHSWRALKTGFQNPVGAISEARPVRNPNQRYECLLAFPGVPSYKENQLITNQQILFMRYAHYRSRFGDRSYR